MIFPLLAFLTSFNLQAQKKIDPGIVLGTSYYMGDLNVSSHFQMPSFAGGPIVRYNFDARNSVRVHAVYHTLKGENPEYVAPIANGEAPLFEAKFVDLGLNYEFNWWPYKTAFRKTLMSPYVFGGLGYDLRIIPVENANVKSHVVIPFGVGYKINVGQWLSAGLELGARKTFSDNIDGVTNPVRSPELSNLHIGNKDWYFFTGVFVTYKIFKFWDTCPTYDD